MAAALLALVTGLLLGPASVPSAAGADKKSFTVAFTSDVDSLNPFLGVESNSYEVWALTYDYLVNYSMKDMSPEPGLATSWDISDDGKTWTFHMRQGVKWSDGKPLTAEDVAWTYGRVLAGGVESVNWATYLSSVTKVTAQDDRTVVLKLSKPNAVLPLLPIPILPKHVWSKISEKTMKSYAAEPKNGRPVVGSGPFRLVSGTAGGSTFRFEANPDYWGGTPHVDEVNFRIYKTADPAVQALIKGEVDFVEDINALQIKALEGRDGITAHNGVSPLFEEIGFNTGAVDTKTGKPIGDGNPALKDQRFRHALGYAVDLDRVIKTAFRGVGDPGSTIVPARYSTYHWEPPADQAFTFDLDKAGDLLDEAGYRKGADGQRTMPDGKPLGTLRLFARTGRKESIDTMELFKEWLADLGITAKVTIMDTNKMNDVILSGDYDAFQWDWYVEQDPDSILSDFTCAQRGGSSDSWYCNKAYDALYTQQNSEMDHAKRVQLIKRMQEMIYKDSPYIVTAYTKIGEAFRSDRFACFEPQPTAGGVWLVQYGAHNYVSLRPSDEAGNCDGVTSAVGAETSGADGTDGTGSDGGTGTSALLIGGGVLVLVLLAGGGLLAARRRSTVGDRE